MLQTKRRKFIKEQINAEASYSVVEAIDVLKKLSTVKFTESVDVSFNLGIDPKKSDQNVRGAIVLPHGTGKTVKVAVFAQADKAEQAKAAGADIVGFEDLFEQIKKGEIDFDVLIATPDTMKMVGQLGQILGPRGLMPNPKVGTVTMDVQTAVANAKAGQVQFRADKGGIVHSSIGKLDFSNDNLHGNLDALHSALLKAKPATAKGVYTKKITLSSTMGPGLTIDINSISK